MSELSEKISFLRYLYREICVGFSEFKYLEEPIFIKHLTELEIGELQKNREKYVNEAKEKGLEFQEDKHIFLTQNGLWERSKDEAIENLEREISNLHQVGKNLFIKRQILQNKSSIKKAEDKLKELNEEKNEALGYCIEDYINKKYNLSLPESEFYETIGGLIAYNTGEIPKKGEKIEIYPYVFTVTKVTSKKIEEINLMFKNEE